MITYPEMNAVIVSLLRGAGQNYSVYAAARIEELERENTRLKGALRNIANGKTVDGDLVHFWGYMDMPYKSAALNALAGGSGIPEGLIRARLPVTGTDGDGGFQKVEQSPISDSQSSTLEGSR